MRCALTVSQDSVGQGRFVDELMPLGDGKLGGDDDRFAGIAFLHHLEQGQSDLRIEWLQADVIEDNQRRSLLMVDLLEIAAIQHDQGYLLDEAVHVEEQGTVSLHASVVSQCSGDEALSAAGRSSDQEVLCLLDVCAFQQHAPLLPGQFSGRRARDILGLGREPELRRLETVGCAFIAAMQDLGLRHGADQLMRIQLLMDLQIELGFLEPGHTMQAEELELVEGLTCVHHG